MKVTDIPKISRLSTAEKILFVEELWDSIVSIERIPIPESHKSELERRLAKYQNRSGCLLSLKELQARIEKRK
ncbi:MAG: addiction module protein [Omnitrophica WOR_2 bacterium RIFCSPLOWO2_12_FULL_46_30]|nr:MAG: addiction module protein [Omnitrophica WOR_2 bacterium RIFCSPLOWO2_02_FULL_45_28]OGX52557.1 MAG: addiction module protein [Omnitrophica WOR_2 bacterium RIFCSPLOWO2_12_FULL_46_30]